MLEHRNDTFKNTAAHSQVKVLQLEQEKVALSPLQYCNDLLHKLNAMIKHDNRIVLSV